MPRYTLKTIAFGAVMSSISLSPSLSQAQALEEVVVTAQRRAQTLQEVPISVEAFNAEEMQRQGYRDLSALAAFSATVNVDAENIIGPAISIRGFGTTGNAVTLESATPIFVDGIHYSRNSMLKSAFMDVEQLEVLKGPQPVYFGQNAIAGAFNIQSKKPTAQWEGNLDMEYGNNNTRDINGGIGGPINDQWRMRVAGKYEDSDGYLNDIVSGDKLGAYENLGGRFTLQWLPSDALTATAKIDYSQIRKDAEAVHICETPGSLIYGRNGPGVPGADGAGGTIGQEDSIYAPPPQGEGWNVPFAIPLDSDCYGNRNGVSAGGPYYQPPDYIREENSEFGSIDIRQAAQGFTSIDNRGINGYEDIDTWTASMNLDYRFDNGVSAQWTTGYVNYLRNYVRDNSYSNFLMNFQGREEKYDQWSSEIRLSSATGGAIEWNISGFYQIGDLDVFSSSLRANVRRGQRYNDIWEDQEWFAGSGVLTFNFLEDNRASIDIGTRIAKLNKETFAIGYAANWVFDVAPCDPDSINKSNPTAAVIASCTGRHASAVQLTPNQVRIFVDGPVDTANLWTTLYDPPGGGGTDKREVPPNWLPSQARAVGLSLPDYATRSAREGGPWLGDFGKTELDPQVTLRYRWSDEINVYGRWAQSSKAGGFDTGQTSLSGSFEEFVFSPEYAETFEIGAKGSYMERRGRFEATLFTLEFTDLQISVATNNIDDPFVNLNAGSQRVRGLEFSNQFAVNDRLVLGVGGAILDGEFTNFPNATCNIAEFNDAANNDCISEAEAIALGNPELEGRIDRSGSKSPRTPDWKFVFDANYWMPVFDQYMLTFNAKAYYSDGYITDTNGFTLTDSYKTHGDLNLNIGFGDLNDVWSVSLYGRNLLQARPTYQPEFDLEADGILQTSISPSSFASYGVKLQYNFR